VVFGGRDIESVEDGGPAVVSLNERIASSVSAQRGEKVGAKSSSLGGLRQDRCRPRDDVGNEVARRCADGEAHVAKAGAERAGIMTVQLVVKEPGRWW